MGSKYKIRKDDARALFATAEMLMAGRYHEIYEQLGWHKGANGNFHCWNSGGHARGVDSNPSLSVNPNTGVWHCFTCGIKGNIQKYWSEFIKGRESGDSYTDWLIDFLGISKSESFGLSSSEKDPEFKEFANKIREIHEKLQNEYVKKTGKRYILSGELCELLKETHTIPMDQLDEWVDTLLANKEAMLYLFETRRITEDVIKKYRLGLNKYGKFIFPIINTEGYLINAKAYDPRCKDPQFKWAYLYKGYGTGPMPINNFTQQKIYFFAGEPDCYCAISMGITGAVTFGSEAITDVEKEFGPEKARQIFLGKEIVIVFDSDEKGLESAPKLAKSLYPYAKQIKIINLDKTESFPLGLDPTKTKEVPGDDKNKKKRIEKDFTDYLKKNNFEKSAMEAFNDLVENTTVYTQNFDRISREKYKITLQESRYPKYFSADGSKILEIISSVGEMNEKAFMCFTNFRIVCSVMNRPEGPFRMCGNCSLPVMPNFLGSRGLNFHLVREIPKEHVNNPLYIKVDDHDFLGLIEVLDNQKETQQKVLCGINKRCEMVKVIDGIPEKFLRVKLKKDINEYVPIQNITTTGGADIDVDAYMIGEKDIYPNKTYNFEAVQTSAWSGQHAVLFIHKAEPIETCIDGFHQTEETHELLQIFKPKKDESIADHLKKRYDIFGDAAGLTGRQEMFFLSDLAFFSTPEINNKLLPQVPRGWVEILIAGDTRTGKSIVARFLHNQYKIGDVITGSTAVTRSGLMGGITKTNNKSVISWGKIPMNDKSIIIIDELSQVNMEVLHDMKGCRSEGIVSIDTIKSGRALARTRKLMLSNKREGQDDKAKGVQFIKDLCGNAETVARFDLAWVPRKTDIDVRTFKSEYKPIFTEFTEYQCQMLIRFVYSRTPSEIILEDGFEEAVVNHTNVLLEKYHPSTELINQEMNARLVRLSVSLASMLYSTVEGDWNKIFVKKEHTDYIVNFINYLYCHPNMDLDNYSKKMRQKEILGDMTFMESISQFVDLDQLNQDGEFTDKALQQIFFVYLQAVQERKLVLPDIKNTSITIAAPTGLRIFEGLCKLISLLISKHCLDRTERGTYKKTAAFNEWLNNRTREDYDQSKANILEYREDQSYSKIIEASERFVQSNR